MKSSESKLKEVKCRTRNYIQWILLLFFFLIFFNKFMLGITLNFDISAGLIPQRSTIICHDIKYYLKKKENI